MTLRVVAVSAPDWVAGSKDTGALNSRDPASLQNACRYAAKRADDPQSAWSRSNWSSPRTSLRSKLLLMYSLDEMPLFDALLAHETPNLLLIGAMSLCFPGAIACAVRARELLGHDLLIVLGGRHACETLYLGDRRQRSSSSVQHHAGSPVTLMQSGEIPSVFDLVISGDAEHIIAEIGELVDSVGAQAIRSDRKRHLATIDQQTEGEWIIGWTEQGHSEAIVSSGAPIDYNKMPSPVSVFGTGGSFDVFGGRMTAHVFSDTGRGCIYDCNFCSERHSATGGVRDLPSAADRLYRQLHDAHRVIHADHPGKGASAFVEDSVLLGGVPKIIRRFTNMLRENPIDLIFGCQMTVDQILRDGDLIRGLRDVGLAYIFIGIETLDPDQIGGMSKDIGRLRSAWASRIERTLEFLLKEGIGCGSALLFGLGESHTSRMSLLSELRKFRSKYGAPHPVSANWAVQHPLCGEDASAAYKYVDWGTPDGEFLETFHSFGEASLLYPLPHVGRPVLTELREVADALPGLQIPPVRDSGNASEGRQTDSLFEKL